jgi:hypothetical protein
VFSSGEKSSEKYESREIQPSAPTKRLLKLAEEREASASVADSAFRDKGNDAGTAREWKGRYFWRPTRAVVRAAPFMGWRAAAAPREAQAMPHGVS